MLAEPPHLPSICLLYTGGTIGMARVKTEKGFLLVPPDNASNFLEALNAKEEAEKIAHIHFEQLMNKDSTNMVPSDWTEIAKAIYDRRNKGYAGFVIAHGTDTMHFSSSAIAFAFGRNLNFPIVFTGAQTTPDIAHGDARVNLLRAIKTACRNVAEVVVTFGDYVFRGCRVQKKDERRFDAFESPATFPLGYVTEEIILSPEVRKREDANQEIDFRPHFADGIIQISLIPGLLPATLQPLIESGTCKGVVLQSFGAGNVPSDGAYSFATFIRSATGKGIPVVIASQFPANSTLASHYAPGIAAIDAGAIPTGNMTNAAATVKFRWVLYQVEQDIREGRITPDEKLSRIKDQMNKSYVGELTEVSPAV
jgi:L-asparaginase type I